MTGDARLGREVRLREDQWRTLREMNTLDEFVPPTRVTAVNGLLELAFELPMPGVSYLELVP